MNEIDKIIHYVSQNSDMRYAYQQSFFDGAYDCYFGVTDCHGKTYSFGMIRIRLSKAEVERILEKHVIEREFLSKLKMSKELK